MSVLLTDEEILKLREKLEEADAECQLMQSEVKTIALAQAQRITGWGEEICIDHKSCCPHRECPKCWQALKEEVGL